MFDLSDNLTHLIALMGLLAATVLLVIFAHGYISSDYVFGTMATMAGALFGYKFGVGTTTPSSTPVVPPEQTHPPIAG